MYEVFLFNTSDPQKVIDERKTKASLPKATLMYLISLNVKLLNGSEEKTMRYQTHI